MLIMAMTELNFSARAYDHIVKVARTIADLAGAEIFPANTFPRRSDTVRLTGSCGHESGYVPAFQHKLNWQAVGMDGKWPREPGDFYSTKRHEGLP